VSDGKVHRADQAGGDTGLLPRPPGTKGAAKRHGVNVESLRRWAAAYRRHGAAGILRRKKRIYSVEAKLAVLQRLKKENLSYRQAAAIFDIRRFNIIKDWEIAYESGGIAALVPYYPGRRRKMKKTSTAHPDPDQPVGDDGPSKRQLLDEIARLRMENAYLKNSRP
jgi:transposase